MPTTYNGIGTHYYGKKNQQKRQGTCRHCGRQVELTSHDTRLWFVVFFIPIIPLGRKRIIDQCPACTWHYAQPLGQWETARQLEISGALDKFRTNPTPDAAIEAHQMLVAFQQTAEAAEFRAMMKNRFPDNAKVHAHLGAVLDHLGQAGEAAECYLRALELRPDLPEARVGVAQAHIRARRLDEARALLDFLEKPGAAQLYSLAPLETLARALQEAGRHEDALQLFGHLIAGLPVIADYTEFRKLVQKSEKALGRTTSVLPARKFSWRRLWRGDPTTSTSPRVTARGLAWAGIIIAAGVFVAVAYNEYVRRHRRVHVVNGLPQAAVIEIRGGTSHIVRTGTAEIPLPEGDHHATIRVDGAPPEELDFTVRSDFFDRWFGHPFWVINVRGAAILVTTTATYSREELPPTLAFRFGQTFEYFPEISHPFQALPETLRLKSSETRTLTQLDVFRGKPIGIYNFLLGQGQSSEAWRLAESRLRLQPGDEDLLRAYVDTARREQQLNRAEKFLEIGLTNRPVLIEWHRSFQGLKSDRARDARLAAEYDRLLQAEPGNSALLYLRGRLAEDRTEARRYFERARAADPINPYPHYAQGYDRSIQGDWAGARELFRRAVELRPGDSGFGRHYAVARMAMGEHGALEQECRDQLRRNPLDVGTSVFLCDVLVAAGKTNDAFQVLSAFERSVVAARGNGPELARFLRRRLLYETRDFAGLEKHCANDRSPAGRMGLFQARLELGRVAEALQAYRDGFGAEDTQPGAFALSVALAWRLAGQEAEARDWQERAAAALAAGDADHQRAAALLRAADPPQDGEVADLALVPDVKALLVACLARQHPARYAALAAVARTLNVERDFPYHLVARAVAPESTRP